MKKVVKQMVKKICPPILLDFLKKSPQYGFGGNYKSWKEACAHSSGYDAPAILQKVKDSLLKVKNGEAVYERDSVIFDTIQYSWPVLSGLLWIASQKDNELSVLDFGGSLGSSYFQNKSFLQHLKKLNWNIVEQANFVYCGKQCFENENLRFFETIEACKQGNKIDIFFASGTLQYLENPYLFMEQTVNLNFPYIILDRTTFLKDSERITVQKVRPGIYDASYPAWFLNEKKFLEIFDKKYKLITDFDSLAGEIKLTDTVAFEKGFIFQKK